MTDREGLDYYVGVLPKPPAVDEQWVEFLGRKLRDLRIDILSESAKALGRSSLTTESNRSPETYVEDVGGPTQLWVVCCAYKPGMRGNIFQSARTEQISDDADHANPAPNSDDQEIMTRGTWIRLEMGYGPIPQDQWALPSCGNALGSHRDHRYHLTNLYVKKKDYRRISTRPSKSLVEIIEATLTANIVSRIRSSSADHLPVIFRRRLIVSPENVAQSSLMNRYINWWGFTVTGWVPKVTALLVNLTRVEQWPLPDEDPEFYTKCEWAVMETVWKVGRSSFDCITQDAVGERARL